MIARRLQTRRGSLLLAVLAVALLAMAAGGSWLWRIRSSGPSRVQSTKPTPGARSVVVSLPPPDLIRPLTPDQAVSENEKRAPTTRLDQAAAAFRPQFKGAEDKTRALDCLSQAIYYEAATEPLEGKEAVAQIVLNRVRHPAFPASICGVVYQGSDRPTGCQFTFACDGSLRRTPVASYLNEARKVAARALAGKVFAPVGHATHYHADYVVPYWADSLDKEVHIGRHIFYRLKRGLGSVQEFRQIYRGIEPIQLTATDVAVAVAASVNAPELTATTSSSIAPDTSAPFLAPRNARPLLADLTHGQLVLDADRSPLTPLQGEIAGPLGSGVSADCPSAKNGAAEQSCK